MTYEFINPSDEITFCASTNQVAFVVALWIGSGQCGCTRDDGKKIDTCFLFSGSDALEAAVKEQLDGQTVEEFLKDHKPEIAQALESFAYYGFGERELHDEKIARLKAEDKDAELAAYLRAHEDKRRTSMTSYVQLAWSMAKAIRNEIAAAEDTTPSETH